MKSLNFKLFFFTLLIPLLVLLPYFLKFTHPVLQFGDPDLFWTFYPYEKFFFDFFDKNNYIPFYLFNNGLGQSLGLDPQYGHTYLLKYLFLFLFDNFNSYGLFYAYFHMLVGFLSAYKLSKVFVISFEARIIVSIAYLCNSTFIIWQGFPHIYSFIAFYPLVLYSVLRLLNFQSNRDVLFSTLLLGLTSGLISTGSHTSVILLISFTILLIFIFYLFFNKDLITKFLFVCIGASIICLIISYPSLFEFFDNNRAERFNVAKMIPFYDYFVNIFAFNTSLVTYNFWFNGFIYFGALTIFIFLYLINIKSYFNYDKSKIIPLFVIFFTLIISSNTFIYPLLHEHVPFFNNLSNLNRFNFTLTIFYSLMIGIGFENLKNNFHSLSLYGNNFLFLIISIGLVLLIFTRQGYEFKEYLLIIFFLFSIQCNLKNKLPLLILFSIISYYLYFINNNLNTSRLLNILDLFIILQISLLFYIFLKRKKTNSIFYFTILVLIINALFLYQKGFLINAKDKVTNDKTNFRNTLLSFIETDQTRSSHKYIFIDNKSENQVFPSTNLLVNNFFTIDAYQSFYKSEFLEVMDFIHNTTGHRSMIIHKNKRGHLTSESFDLLNEIGVTRYIIPNGYKNTPSEFIEIFSNKYFSIFEDPKKPNLIHINNKKNILRKNDENFNLIWYEKLNELNYKIDNISYNPEKLLITFKSLVTLNESIMLPFQFDKNFKINFFDNDRLVWAGKPYKNEKNWITLPSMNISFNKLELSYDVRNKIYSLIFTFIFLFLILILICMFTLSLKNKQNNIH